MIYTDKDICPILKTILIDFKLVSFSGSTLLASAVDLEIVGAHGVLL